MGNSELPLVSVRISAYNHDKYIAEAIESVINQTYQNLEFIIVNDGSTDNTHDIISKYIEQCQKRFVRFEYRNRENKGLSATLNECIKWSKGKYSTGTASDDVMLPNKISLLVEKLEKLDDSYAAAFGDASFIDANSEKIYLDLKSSKKIEKEMRTNSFLDFYTNNRDINYKDKNIFGSYETLLSGNYLPAMSAVVKLDKIRKIGGWTNGNTIEDWEMWLKLSKKYKFTFIDKSVAFYRWHESNTIKTNTTHLEVDSMKLILKEEEDCKGNKDLMIVWMNTYNNKLLSFLYLKRVDLFLEFLKLKYCRSFILFIFKKVIRKFL